MLHSNNCQWSDPIYELLTSVVLTECHYLRLQKFADLLVTGHLRYPTTLVEKRVTLVPQWSEYPKELCSETPQLLQYPRPYPCPEAQDVLLADDSITLRTSELPPPSWWVLWHCLYRVGQIFTRASWPFQRIPCIVHFHMVCCDQD